MSRNHVHKASVARASVVALALLTLFGACDSTATLFPQTLRFDRAMIVSSYPAVNTGSGWQRQCGVGAVDGFMTNIALVSNQRGTSSDADKDLGIRPLDVVNFRVVEGGNPDDINLVNAGAISLDVDCIDKQPRTPGGTPASCEGANPSFSVDEVSYVANNAKRGDGHNVMILVDQSGSIAGLVDTDRNNIENEPGTFTIPSNFRPLASDASNVRLSAVTRLISQLNITQGEDRVGVLAFSEAYPSGRLSIPCTEAVGAGDVQADMDLCFGKRNRDIWDPSVLVGEARGRSSLWEAVDWAYDYLVGLDDPTRGNHIVVLTDGPDTCASSESMTECSAACSFTGADEVMDKVEADFQDPNGPRVRMHFVQFESLGYPGRDARQVAASCITGGHYQFINSNAFPTSSPQEFSAAVETAILNVRNMLSGHWQLAAGVPAFQSNAAAPTGTPPGSLYALSGILSFDIQASNLTEDATKTTFPFGIGVGAEGNEADKWDRRPVLRKTCGSDAECGAANAAGACNIICSAETLTCPNGAAGVTAPDTSQCSLDGGGSGFCCQGTCEAAGQCASCQ